VLPSSDAAGSQHTLVDGSQKMSGPGGSPGIELGKVDRIRIEPSIRIDDEPTGFGARLVLIWSVSRPSAVMGHPQQTCMFCAASKP
jgi:hypothetical protein